MTPEYEIDWQVAKVFEKEGLAVVVNKLPMRRPRYSLMVGRVLPDGHIVQHVHPVIRNGELKSVTHIITELYDSAEKWLMEQLATERAEMTYSMGDALRRSGGVMPVVEVVHSRRVSDDEKSDAAAAKRSFRLPPRRR